MEIGKESNRKNVDGEILGVMATVKSIIDVKDDNLELWQNLWNEMAGRWHLEGRQLWGENENGRNWNGEYEKEITGGMEINKIDVISRGEKLNYVHIFLARKNESREVLGTIVEAKMNGQTLSFDSF